MRLDHQFTHPARMKVYEIASLFGDSVLDVGCGPGVDYQGFIDLGMKYVGIDITKKFVDRFKELHPRADVRHHSSLSIPFQDEEFSIVYSGGMIQHMHPKDYPKAMKEMWRVCSRVLILTTSMAFTKKHDVIQMASNGKVYDNHYGMVSFLEIVHALPRFEDVSFHENIKHVKGHPYTIVVITKRENNDG